MLRPIKALRAGVTPLTGGSFERAGIKKYVSRMLRKEDSGIDRSEAKQVIESLTYARLLAKQ